MKRGLHFWVLLGLALGAPLTVAAQADDPDAYGDEYAPGDYGRIRFEENGATVIRAASHPERGDEVASQNAPLFPGDRVRTGRDQRVEVQLAGGALVRVNRDAEVVFQALPRPGARYEDNTVLRLLAGAARIASSGGEDEGDFRVDTPSASVYLLGDVEIRVDVDPDGRTSVASHRGVAEVVGDGGSVLVRGGMRTVVDPGSVPSAPRPFNTFASDSFDGWCEARDDAYRVRDRYRSAGGYDGDPYDELPYEVRPYYSELSASGQWTWAPTYGWVWYPYDMAPGWRPYYDGYWHYGASGYFWVSQEPWGWAPYHYGRWNWIGGHGWCWIPGSVFAGAWVSWSWGSLYVGWAPLDYWNRPAFVSTVVYDYYDPACWTFVHYDHFGGRDIHRHVVPVDRIGASLRDTPVVTRPPRIPPRSLVTSPAERERAVREVRDDRSARMRPVSKNATPGREFRATETRVPDRASAGRRDAARSGRSGEGIRPPSGDARPLPSPAPRPTRAKAEERRSAAGDTTRPPSGEPARGTRAPSEGRAPAAARDRGAARPSEDAVSRPRRLTEDPRRSRSDPAATRDAGGTRAPARAGRDSGDRGPSVALPQRSAQQETRQRVREMYDRAAQPRETRAQGRESAPAPRSQPSRPPSTGRAPERPRANPTPSKPPSAGGGQRRESPASRPSSSGHGGGGGAQKNSERRKR